MTVPIGNKSFEKLMATAKDLFWKHGIRRVTVEEICQEAGVSKMTFYRFFKNKKVCARQVLMRTGEEGLQKYRAIMHDESLPFPERIKRILQQKFEATDHVGPALIKDLYRNPESELFKELKGMQQGSLTEFMQDLTDAQSKGWIRKDVKPAFMMYYLQKAHEMASDESLTSMYGNMQDLVMEITRFFFYGIGVKDMEENEPE